MNCKFERRDLYGSSAGRAAKAGRGRHEQVELAGALANSARIIDLVLRFESHGKKRYRQGRALGLTPRHTHFIACPSPLRKGGYVTSIHRKGEGVADAKNHLVVLSPSAALTVPALIAD